MYTRKKSSILAAGLLYSIATATAQQTPNTAPVATVPKLVHFAGSFHPPADQPAGPLGATFAVYGEPDGGTALWSEDQNVQLDASGNYAVMLGSTKNAGVPVELFATGEPRWLQVKFHLPAEVTLPRVMLVSVPYALRAADAETIGGLPPSAFVLAAPMPGNDATGADSHKMIADSATPAVSGTGTTDFIPLWLNSTGTLGNSALFQSGTGSSAKVGINITTPVSALDVQGATTIRGALTMTAINKGTASAGSISQPFNLNASAFNSATGTALAQTFHLQAEPTNNNTTSPGGTLNLLFSAGGSTPVETGFRIDSNGQITFAPGQTFPGGGGGGGTVTSVGSGAGLAGGPITGAGTLSIASAGVTNTMLVNPSLTVTAGTGLTGGGAIALGSGATLGVDATKVPLLSAANTFTGNQTVNGNLTATGMVTGSSYQIGSGLFAFGSQTSQSAYLGFAGNATTSATANTGTGVRALISNSTGTDNTAIGANAMVANTTGSFNTAVGSLALNVNGSIGNTATGYSALGVNTTGQLNTADGYEALFTNSSGTYNTAVGDAALYGNTTGTGNTAIGIGALGANTTGSYNVAIGYASGSTAGIDYQVSGGPNTYVGYMAGPINQTPLVNATALGAHAAVGVSNALILGGTGSSAVSVGIGTATPYNDYALVVDSQTSGLINGGVVSNATGGNIYLGMTNGVHKFRVDFNGAVYADGGVNTSGADFAESVAVHGPRSMYEPGDVLEIDQRANRHLTLSHHAYATMVAGIYSTKPGLLASPHHIDNPAAMEREVPLAVMGIVPCKVTAENGAIGRGDLLVASSRPGYAMKGTNRRRMLGAVVGKALEPLPKGTGVIQVMVTLQ